MNYLTNHFIAGRFLGCRVISLGIDHFFATVHFPPWTGQTTKTTDELQLHLIKVCQNLPSRCEPVIAGYFNCRFGMPTPKSKQRLPGHGLAYGTPMIESAQGAMVRQWALQANLCASNTFASPTTNGHVPTWLSGTLKGNTSICDYIFVSQSAFGSKKAKDAWVSPYLGRP